MLRERFQDDESAWLRPSQVTLFFFSQRVSGLNFILDVYFSKTQFYFFLLQIRSQFQILAREQRELAGSLAEDGDDVAAREEENLLLQAGRAVAQD